jgi:hypothetical protein
MNGPRLTPACRLYVLVAQQADVALVVRRGPSDWWHLLHWDLAKLTLTPGAWFHGNIYPRRSDISPDGRLFAYFAHKGGAHSQWPDAYCAVSKAPWLEALVAWKTGGTWTWGCQFSQKGELRICACVEEKPFHGSYPGSILIGSMNTDWPKRDVWNEVKRGWHFAEPDDPMVASVPAQPNLVVRREQPAASGGVTLGLIHQGVDFRRPGIEGVQLEYFLQDMPGDVAPLPEAAWADWDHQGRLLMANRDGELAVCECRGTRLTRVWSQDLRDQTPNPQPAPEWAGRW